MPAYLFQLGREPELSTAEIRAVFSLWNIASGEAGCSPVFPKTGYCIVETQSPLDAQALIARLGGTIKIAQKIPPSGNRQAAIAAWLEATQPSHKIEFSLSGDGANAHALEIKKYLKTRGRSVRYIEPKNTATILHNRLVEHKGDLTEIGEDVFATEAIQPIEEFGLREYGRPGSDSRSGMLPIKLAKMMVNLAQIPSDATILDPFCGSGTILTEALAMGYTHLVGSDISAKAVEDTRKNIEWIKNRLGGRKPEAEVLVADVRKISQHIPKESISAIITEPYLGKPLRGNESRQALAQQAQELKKLYIAAFQSFQNILKKSGAVIFIIPSFRFQKEWISIDIRPEIKKLGFTPRIFDGNMPSLRYVRESQHVARNIWRFKKM